MFKYGDRIRVKGTSKRHRHLRGMTGTILRHDGYGDWSVELDAPAPGAIDRTIWVTDPITKRNERRLVYNHAFVYYSSMDKVEIDVGDLEDDL